MFKGLSTRAIHEKTEQNVVHISDIFDRSFISTVTTFHKISKQNVSMFDLNNLPSCPFFLRVSVPTQPSLPLSFLELSRVRVPVGEPGLEGEDAMFLLPMNLPVSKRMLIRRTIFIGRLSFQGPIAVVVISSTSECLEISKNGGELDILY